MPAVSRAQQRLMQAAEHGATLSATQLHDFAVGSEAGKPVHVPSAKGSSMARLTTKSRNSLAGHSFALPGRRYPIENPNHARAALQRVSQFGTAAEQATVRSKVARKFPGIKQGA